MKTKQEKFEVVLEDNEKIEQFILDLQAINSRMDELKTYYYGEWMTDYETVKENYSILNQDSIFEAMVDQNHLLLKLNKVIAQMLVEGDDE